MLPRSRSLLRARRPLRRGGVVTVISALALAASLLVAPAAASAVTPRTDIASAAPAVDAGIVQAAAVVGFNPESIISDALFYDGNAMSAAEIQAFLNAKIGTCQNGKCLNVLTTGISSRGAVVSQTTGNLICSAIQGGTMPVSELIYRVQVACGISAKVILTTLQKEQGLATSKAPSDWNLKAAMGASCPDTAPCDPAFAGVGPQILKGTQQLKTYKAANFAKQPGNNFIGYNPNSACGGTNLNIRNYATAALYSYTPYQPNAAALAAGYGLGDGCSSYGNRNFYNYYTAWFGSTQYPQTDTPFVDVSSVTTSIAYSPFAADIVWLNSQGISAGYSLGAGYRAFRPTEQVTRGVMAAFLYRLAGSPAFDAPAASPFTDVPTTYTFYKEVSWLVSSGVYGTSNPQSSSRFGVDDVVTRAEMAGLLYRFVGSPAFTAPAQSAFTDVATGEDAYPAIAWLAGVGVSRGWAFPDGVEFRPAAGVTRDVMAAFLRRTFGYLHPFVDVSPMTSSGVYNVFGDDIAWLASTKASEGWTLTGGQREYRPGSDVNRDVMAAFLYRLAGSPQFTPPAVSPFSDVSVGRTFYKEIAWLASEKISEGWTMPGGSVEFRPSIPVTRDVMAAFLYRFAGSPSYTAPAESAFDDVPSSRTFYREISWMASVDISRGWEAADGQLEFRAGTDVTRDTMAAFLNRLMRLTAR